MTIVPMLVISALLNPVNVNCFSYLFQQAFKYCSWMLCLRFVSSCYVSYVHCLKDAFVFPYFSTFAEKKVCYI